MLAIRNGVFWSVPVLALAALPAHDRAAETAADAAKASAALRDVNAQARAFYSAARNRALARTGPVVLWDGETLVLRYGEHRRTATPRQELYTDLKSASHVALGLHSFFAGQADGKLSDARTFALKEYRAAVAAARVAAAQRPLSPAQHERQKKLLTACLDLIDGVLKAGRAERKEAVAALRKLRPMIDENSKDAARAQVETLHREMQTVRAKLSERDWGRLKVIVMGSQMPRKGNLAVQYFARLLGEKGEGVRIIYAEGIFDEAKALALLGTHLVDTRIGEDFFEDATYMHRDLLDAPARAALDELFAPGGAAKKEGEAGK